MGDWLKSMLYFEWLIGTHINLASYVMVAVFVFTAIWAWTFSYSYIMEDAPTRRRWRDLRIWAVVLLAVQTVLYVHFGIK
jgi:hypothetical protein